MKHAKRYRWVKNLSTQVDGPSKKRGRPKRRRMKVVTMDQRKCNISDDLAWNGKTRIHVALTLI